MKGSQAARKTKEQQTKGGLTYKLHSLRFQSVDIFNYKGLSRTADKLISTFLWKEKE